MPAIIMTFTKEKIFTLFRTIFVSFLCILMNFSLLFFPSSIYASDLDAIPSISSVSENFSDEVCLSLSNGITPENATELAAQKMIRNLIFSGELDEILSVPKDEMVEYISSKVFSRCESDIILSKAEYNNYLLSLAEKDPKNSTPEPFKPFGMG